MINERSGWYLAMINTSRAAPIRDARPDLYNAIYARSLSLSVYTRLHLSLYLQSTGRAAPDCLSLSLQGFACAGALSFSSCARVPRSFVLYYVSVGFAGWIICRAVLLWTRDRGGASREGLAFLKVLLSLCATVSYGALRLQDRPEMQRASILFV